MRRARRGTLAAFFVVGGAMGTWAPRLPAIQATLGVNEEALAVPLTGLALGMLIGTRIAPPPIDRLGSAASVRIGTAALALLLVGPGFAVDVPSLTVALVALGTAAGFVDVAMNAEAVAVERIYGRPIMSMFHALFSVGGLSGAVVASAAADAHLTPRAHLLVFAGAIALGTPLWFGALVGRLDERTVERSRAKERPAWTLPVVLLGLIGSSAFVAEGTAADWSAVYLRRIVGTSDAFAAGGFAAFSLATAGLRLVGDRLTRRLGAVRVVRVGGLLAAVSVAQAIVVPTAWGTVVGFALLGAGLSTVVPIVFSAAGHRSDGPTALARVVTMSYLGSVVGPVVVGFLTAAAGLRLALGLPVALATLLALVARPAISPGDAAGGRSPQHVHQASPKATSRARVHDRTIDRAGLG